jgi:hypothetical protein
MEKGQFGQVDLFSRDGRFLTEKLPPGAKQAAEKVCTRQESNTSGAKARRILNHLWPD